MAFRRPRMRLPIRRGLMTLAGLLLSANACAGECIASHPIAFDAFMVDAVSVDAALTLRVPEGFRHAALGEEHEGYAYWMRSDAARRARGSGELPVDSGYMYGKVSMDVGYDRERDVFIGAEDLRSTLEDAGFEVLDIERTARNGHALLFLRVVQREGRKPIYALYAATGRDTTVVYLAWRPPGNDSRIGDCFWSAFRETVMSSAPVAR